MECQYHSFFKNIVHDNDYDEYFYTMRIIDEK